MAEPLDTGDITFWLHFINDGSAVIQIDEPIGFDSAEFISLQDDGRYGRDVSLSGEEIDFGFPNTEGSRYGYQFDKFIQFDDIYGYESEVMFIIKNNGLDFIVGQVDFFSKTTDREYSFDCKMIQATKQQLIKRRAKVEVDLFGTQDLDENTIEGIETSNILLVARPLEKISSWDSPREIVSERLKANSRRYFTYNPCQSLVRADIDDSLTFFNWIEEVFQEEDVNSIADEFKIILAQSQLENVTVRIQNLQWSQDVDGDNGGDGYASNKFILSWGESIDNLSGSIELESLFLRDDESGSFSIIDETYDIGDVERGHSIWLYFYANVRQSSSLPAARLEAFTSVSKFTVDVTATTVSVNSFTKGARLVDAFKQLNKNINTELEVVAPEFELGGQFYNNFVFDGNMIRGRDTKFVMKWDNVSDLLTEFNGDYEINKNELFVARYESFYELTEVEAFLIAPDQDLTLPYNEKFAINKFSLGFKDFDQDKDDQGTLKSMHTNVVFSLGNKQVENEKEVEIDIIRDAFMIETTRRKAFESNNSGSSSLRQDKKIFIIDVVEKPVGLENQYTHVLFHAKLEDGRIQLRNRNDFNFTLMGFSIGDFIDLDNTDNEGRYMVQEMEPGYITLDPSGFLIPSGIGEQITKFTYPYSNIDYIARTNENFQLIEGVNSPERYVNLLYTPKRNILNNWSSYLASCVIYTESGLNVKSFTNEPELVTNFNNTGDIIENSNISKEELGAPLLSARLIETKVICDFSTYQRYVDRLQDKRGFVRVYDMSGRVRKGFPKESRYSWKDNLLELTLEELFESEVLEVSFWYPAESYYINRAGYPQAVLPDLEYQIEGDYIRLVDELNRPLSSLYRYDMVKVQDVFYTNITDLATAISIL